MSRVVEGNADVWVLDLDRRGAFRRISSEPTPDIAPVWSPDGKRIAYGSGKATAGGRGSFSIVLHTTATVGESLLFNTPAMEIPVDWSDDGRFILYRQQLEQSGQLDLWALPMEGSRTPIPVATSGGDERHGQFSPDGKWVAYESNESGRFEVYVRPFPGPAEGAVVSTGGGRQVRWSSDGKELFYIAPDARLMAVAMHSEKDGQTMKPATPVPLFQTTLSATVTGGSVVEYDVSKAGTFLMNTLVVEQTAPITLVLNPGSRRKRRELWNNEALGESTTVPMALTPGTRFGSYEIVGLLGVGGMGEVYRARDTRLGREVALKVLPEAFASDADRRLRFEREAQLLASFNHPNIAAIYSVEDLALVLELVDGPTLADLIGGGTPLPIKDVLPIARQIAEALEAAHEHGVIHRDLKPANIKVRLDGTVKVLDFGLAKALDSGAASPPNVTMSPTLSMQATQAGIILGTAAYMSPEQAAGKTADTRSDLWAFGVVLLEMLTGRQAFTGETVPHILASVLKSDPDWSGLPAETPAAIRRLLKRCLEKDRKRRLDSAAVARLEIEEALGSPDVQPVVPTTLRFRRAAWATLGVALLVGALAAAVGAWAFLRPTQSGQRPPTRFTVATEGQALFLNPFDRNVALSPDGRYIVHVTAAGVSRGTGGRLVLRQMDRLDLTALQATASARSPFFSHDSQWIGFFDATELKKVSIGDGPAIALCAYNGAPRGASWGEDGTVVFATADPNTGLWRVPAGGGQPTVLTTPDTTKGEGDHWFPSVLPAGRGVLFTVEATGELDNSEIVVLDLKNNERRTLIRGGRQAEYIHSGHLVYAVASTLLAVRFDLATLQVISDPMPVVDQVRMSSSTGAANYAVSRSGALAYVPGNSSAPVSLVWVDREGREEPVNAPIRAYGAPRLSPLGTQVAVEIRDEENDIWILDLARGTALRKLTYGRAAETNPLWLDDTHLIFTSNRSGRPALYRQAADGTGMPQPLTTTGNGKYATSVTRDGSGLLGHQDGPSGFDVVLFPIPKSRGSPSDAPPSVQELVKTRYFEHNADLSPNGRYLAYQSNEAGPFQIIVRPFPQVERGQWTISSGTGSQPVWAQNGKELFYRGESDALIAVPVDTSGTTFSWGAPIKLFSLQNAFGQVQRNYDVASDGRRFLMLKEIGNSKADDIVVVLDWVEELKAKVPAGQFGRRP
jgi:serine/threonine-protein kinase